MQPHMALWLVFAVAPAATLAQEPLRRPVGAVYVGVGNHYGWLGVGAEAYPVPSRLSVFAGVGIAPQGPTVAGAGGVRYYVPLASTPHRFFADLSVSLMHLFRPVVPGGRLGRKYGAGLSVGYSYLAQSGLTLTAGGGVGSSQIGPDYFELLPVVQIGVGWTWRR